jgi:hypothetical protein
MYKLLSVFSICSMLWVSAAAHAQTNDSTKAARRAYAQGQELFRRGDYVGAERSFREAYEAVPNPVVLLGIAEAQQRQELWEDAATTLETYLDERPDAPDRAQVSQLLEEIRARPGVLYVESTPPGALILIDGQDTGEITPAEIEVPGGDHMVVVRGPDGYELQAEIQMPIGGEKSLNADLVPPEPEPVASVEPEPDAEGEPYMREGLTDRRVRRAAWGTLGVGAGGLVIGSVLGGLALKQQKDYDESPTLDGADRGERLAIFADVSFGVGIAAIVTSVVLFVTKPSGDDQAAANPRRFALVPEVGREGGGLGALVKF